MTSIVVKIISIEIEGSTILHPKILYVPVCQLVMSSTLLQPPKLEF